LLGTILDWRWWKRKSIGILLPDNQGLSTELLYIPSLVQGHLVSNINKYSAISVLDRISIDKVINETFDPTYENNEEIIRLGHIAHVKLLMIARINNG